MTALVKIHIVAKGETLSKIATKYHTTTTVLHKANSNLIKDINKLQIGWKLTIPNSSEHSESFKTQFQRALKDIRNLESVKKLNNMIGD